MSTGIVPSYDNSAAESAWNVALAASRLAETLERRGGDAAFRVEEQGALQPLAAGAGRADLLWREGRGWESRLDAADPRAGLLSLYLPVCGATAARPLTIGHLGQSLDGFIATHSGDSQFVTGQHNIVHLHWLRALCDAVVVGAGTVAADDPLLTTRHVKGPHPLRVIVDPDRRLAPTFKLFTDTTAPTLYICDRARVRAGETAVGDAAIAGVDGTGAGGLMGQALLLLRQRGCARVFVEGGGVTVSAFLQAGLLDRLHIAVAPVLIGDGRPAIRFTPHALLRDCPRPAYRVFRMGDDVLFDCDLTAEAGAGADVNPAAPQVTRVI